MYKKMILILTMVALLGFINQANATEMIRYNGSSTILKAIMYEAAIQFEQQEGIKFDLKGKSTGFGIKKMLAGECDIAGGGRPLKADEKAKGLVEIKLFLDAYAFIVNKSNPITQISHSQLKDIFNGKLSQWDVLNGPKGKKIIILSPPEASAAYKDFKKIIGFSTLPKNSIKTDMTPNVYKKVKTFPVSIGWLSFATVVNKKDIKVIEISNAGEKVAVDEANIASGKYPYQRSMYFYTKGEPSGNAQKFIEFIQGEKGKSIITEAGFFLPEG